MLYVWFATLKDSVPDLFLKMSSINIKKIASHLIGMQLILTLLTKILSKKLH